MALKRELAEEIGANDLEIVKSFGYIDELRYGINGTQSVYEQTSLYYICKVESFGEPKHIKRELSQGLKTVWIDVREAILHNEQVMQDDNHQKQGLKTVLKRENAVLRKILEEEIRYFEVVSTYKEQSIHLPKRQTLKSAGYDFEVAEDVKLMPQEIKLVPTGIKACFPETEALFIYPRSSLAIKKRVMMANNVGVVDSDYYGNKNNEGHIFIPLYNFSNEIVEIQKGERIAQGIFQKFHTTNDDLANGDRNGGFGSSDNK
ncbi:putative DUTP diphosphatase [Alteracholeplasma palmae J233]|uniref:dUTP diphosphatase n=1 Tax=Alteracholeplasma palmae (strain ATCC 49389 / J233) TaxID=1318466 RepID=U4KJV3_ALTPJ|nr:putative DUTP diphosphatase [Alteracholeplasma palmae J233]